MVKMLDDAALQGLGIANSEIIAAIEAALIASRRGEISAAPKASVIAPDGRYMMATLSASDQMGVIAIKSVMVNDRNKQRGLPGINGAIMLLNSETGELSAVLGANWITAVRTAGLSAVAAKRLANPEAEVIGLIGTGVQAESHLRAFKEIFPLKHARAYGRGKSGIAKMEAVAQELGLSFEVADPRAIRSNPFWMPAGSSPVRSPQLPTWAFLGTTAGSRPSDAYLLTISHRKKPWKRRWWPLSRLPVNLPIWW